LISLRTAKALNAKFAKKIREERKEKRNGKDRALPDLPL
jgi:hypothetical protein